MNTADPDRFSSFPVRLPRGVRSAWIALGYAGAIVVHAGLDQSVIASGGDVASEEWSQWRGPSRDGTAPSGDWPNTLGESALRSEWSVPLAEGYASPVLADDKVFSVETRDKTEEVVRAFDRRDGSPLWEYVVPGAMKVPFYAAKNGSWARSTPATDGSHLYVLSMVDVLTCLDAQTGKPVWQVDFKERVGERVPAFGGVSSPLIDGDALFIQGGFAVTQVDRKSSESRWRVLEDRGGVFGGAFSSPIIATLAGKSQLVAQTRSTLAGIDRESGEVLWSTPVKAFRGMNILTPAVAGNRVFTATYGGGSFCFEVSRGPEGFSVEPVWQREQVEGYMSSPVIIDGYIYHHGRDKRLHCLSLETGETRWVTDEKFGDYWSMVANGSRVLALDEDGTLRLFEASPESFRLLDERPISDEPTWAHLAVSQGQLFVRGLRSMTAYRWGD